MLRDNMCVGRGLMNGALGTVQHIIYEQGAEPPQLPLCVLVKFDQYDGNGLGPAGDRLVPIFPIERNIEVGGSVVCTRKQLPLIPAGRFQYTNLKG
jgi:hypothetical protein